MRVGNAAIRVEQRGFDLRRLVHDDQELPFVALLDTRRRLAMGGCVRSMRGRHGPPILNIDRKLPQARSARAANAERQLRRNPTASLTCLTIGRDGPRARAPSARMRSISAGSPRSRVISAFHRRNARPPRAPRRAFLKPGELEPPCTLSTASFVEPSKRRVDADKIVRLRTALEAGLLGR